jgi:hypothetical protein
MIKAILMVKRRSGLSREEFREPYESGHAPLALQTLPSLRHYVRNYLEPTNGIEPPLDVITEFWYDDVEGQAETQNIYLNDPAQVLQRDEEEFMDRASMVSFSVVECASDVSRRG